MIFGRKRYLARLAASARAKTRRAYGIAAGYYPREYRLSRIVASEGATNVRREVRAGLMVPSVPVARLSEYRREHPRAWALRA